jgi:tetratricopeptide (TPR) repeat protein
MLLAMRILIPFFALLLAGAQAQEVNPDTVFQRAIAEQQQGDYASAIRDYRDYLKLRPNTIEAEVNLGAALAHTGKYDEAIELYRAALPSLTYKNPVLLDLGLAYYKKNDFSHAQEQFATLRELEPRDLKVAILLGDTDVKLGKPEDALTVLQPFDPGESKNLDFEYVLGEALIKSGHLRDGIARIEKVAEGGNSADAYQLAGASLLQLNEFERARHDLEAALHLNPKLPNIYTMVGEARDKTGATAEAESAFLQALQINPDDFEANLYVGGILYKRRDLDKAKLYLDKALKLKPTDLMARYESGMLESASGQYEEAAHDLEQLAKDDPNWLEPHVELASLYYKLHRPQDGARERAIVDRITTEQQTHGPGK